MARVDTFARPAYSASSNRFRVMRSARFSRRASKTSTFTCANVWGPLTRWPCATRLKRAFRSSKTAWSTSGYIYRSARNTAGTTKRIVKHLAEQRLPIEVVHLPKIGFGLTRACGKARPDFYAMARLLTCSNGAPPTKTRFSACCDASLLSIQTHCDGNVAADVFWRRIGDPVVVGPVANENSCMK